MLYGIALQAFDILMSMDVKNALAWFCESLVLINLGKTNQGKKAFIRATQMECGLSLLRRKYGGAIFFVPKNRLYVNRLDRCVRSFQDPSLIWFRKGTELYHNQESAEAIDAFHRSLTLNPENAHGWFYLAQACSRLGRYVQALEAYGHAIAIDPLNAAVWNNKGLIHRRLHQEDAAIASFRRSFTIDPSYFNGWYNLGLIFLDRQVYSKAREAFDHALTLRPGDPRALNRQKFALQGEGEINKSS